MKMSKVAGPAAPEEAPKERVAIDLAAELLRRGRPMELVVGGMSMWPLVRAGERVRLEPAVGARVGQLAAVVRDGRLLVHRVVRAEGGLCELRGDNLERSDGLVPAAQIVGVVTLGWTRSGRRIDHRRFLRRTLDRLVAFVSARSRLPWRLARALWLVKRELAGPKRR